MKKDNKSYDFAKKNKARMSASLRGMVSLYLGYMAWNLIRTSADPGNTLSPQMAWLFGGLFAAIAAGFAYFAWQRYQVDLKEAELSDEEAAALETPEISSGEADEDETL